MKVKITQPYFGYLSGSIGTIESSTSSYHVVKMDSKKLPILVDKKYCVSTIEPPKIVKQQIITDVDFDVTPYL